MEIFPVRRRIRILNRLRQIISVLLKYGFDDVVEVLKTNLALNIGKILVRKAPPLKREERIRKVFEELGPTFIKFGQILSLRPDIIPMKLTDELKKLQDLVPPFPSEIAIKTIEEELDNKITNLFSYFDPNPLAAASISQVHRAKTFSDGEVAVKVRRPNIEKTIKEDLDILFGIAKIIEQKVPELELYNPVQILQEFSSIIKKELNFYYEGRNIDIFRRNFKDDDSVYIPEVYWELTGEKVLTLELIDGVKCSDLEMLERKGLDRKKVAFNGAQLILKQVFEHGFFHADPHPGNIHVLEGNVIAPLDFGIVGRLNDDLKEELENLLIGALKKDINKIIKVFFRIGIIGEKVDIMTLKTDTLEFIDRYYGIQLNQLNIPSIVNEMFEITRKHRIQFPTDFTLLFKSLMTVESIGKLLDPEFNILEGAIPYAKKTVERRIDIKRNVKFLSELLEDSRHLIKNFPSDVFDIIKNVKKGQIKVKLEHKNLEKLILSLERTAKFISMALIIAALMISSSLLVQITGQRFFSLVGIAGFVLALMFTLIILILIFKGSVMK